MTKIIFENKDFWVSYEGGSVYKVGTHAKQRGLITFREREKSRNRAIELCNDLASR